MTENNFSITGIDALVYGVEKMESCKQFYLDWGLSLVSEENHQLVFETQDGGEIILVPSQQGDLPEPIESGPTVRRVIWGVDNETALSQFQEEFSTDKSYQEDAWGPSLTDPNGMRLSFRVSQRKDLQLQGIPINVYGNSQRIDKRSAVYDKAEPVKIGHIVFFVADVMKSVSFYQSLGFQISDYYSETGYFLRCKKVGGHHDLFLLQTPSRKRGLNHVAFVVRDIEEVFGGGIHLNRKGWKTPIGPGRHPVSSSYFWYVHNPCGGLAEYYANEDFCTENWQPKAWESSVEIHAEWGISGGIDAQTRRQVKPE